MCAGTIEIAKMSGSAKGAIGWFTVAQAQVVSDHPYRAQMDEALIIDFTNPERGPSARVSVELSGESARALIKAIEAALLDGELRHGAGH